MDAYKLKPCPFCGGTARIITDVDLGKYPSSLVECLQCGSSTKRIAVDHKYHQITRKEAATMAKIKAIESWNKRFN